MRCILFILFITLILSSCNNDDSPVGASTQPILSVSQTIDSLQFTLIIPKAVFGVRDTLEATLIELNLKTVPETLCVNPVNMPWTLKNDSGKVVLWGPQIIEFHCTEEIISPQQSIVVGIIWCPMPLMPVGSYVLNVDLYPPNLSLNLSIK